CRPTGGRERCRGGRARAQARTRRARTASGQRTDASTASLGGVLPPPRLGRHRTRRAIVPAVPARRNLPPAAALHTRPRGTISMEETMGRLFAALLVSCVIAAPRSDAAAHGKGATLGPFVTLAPPGEPGDPFEMSGTVRSGGGDALPGVRVLVYHADTRARYALKPCGPNPPP